MIQVLQCGRPCRRCRGAARWQRPQPLAHMRARRDASTHGGDITVYSMLAQDVILIAQANFTVGVRGSISESRFDSSLTTLGVPRSKFSSIHARCSRAALDMHEFMLQCYYKNKGPNRREAPGGQSNADLHPTLGDYTPFPFPPAMSSPGDNRPVLPAMTMCWLPRAPQHSEASADTQAHPMSPKEKAQHILDIRTPLTQHSTPHTLSLLFP